ncbi:MAG: hypothetical protein OEL57_12890 [Trichlorobacter sp.]|uniref:hypothetical protein n=1 Tax=Trichlorobacter sp. TaxID=2911007 RepID=UPI002564ACFF|nr:hypothetical protein [Trichlorobacter sp.]MDK9718783.1 hypothetical protein [Trichlorobacter sp.]
MGFETALDILHFITKAITVGYWLFVAAVMLGAFFAFKGKAPLWGRALVSLIIGSMLMSWPIINQIIHSKQKKEHKAVYDVADAQFQMRCKSAGVKIYRTVDNVEGVLLMKLRPKWDPYDQNQIDPYGNDYDDAEGYIGSFLRGRTETWSPVEDPKKAPYPGYRYVDVIEAEGKRYRYTGYMDEIWKRDPNYRKGYSQFALKKQLTKAPAPRYGVTYDDITTPEERKMWIAGSSLKIVDLKTNEVVAERIGYMIDRGMGANGGGRQPWTHAAKWACPKFPGTEQPDKSAQTRNFTEQVLKIKGR